MDTIRDRSFNIMIVDDCIEHLELLKSILEEKGHKVYTFPTGETALRAAAKYAPDLILLDINMPGINGFEVCEKLKSNKHLSAIPVIFLSGIGDTQDKVKAFKIGGVDYIQKPFQIEEVEARVDTHLKIRKYQDEVSRHNQSLQEQVKSQIREISDSQIATILALVKLSESRDEDTGNHINRIQKYCRALARELSRKGNITPAIDENFIENIYYASSMHDIGKVGIPDSILLKPGSLTVQEFDTMKKHTVLGAETLASVLKRYPQNAFISMGMELARSHHERWDGTGYPDGLSSEAIPLSARLTMLADQYDALRNKRPYKPAFDAEKTYRIIVEGDGRTVPTHFDPRVLNAFKRIVSEFDEIFQENEENSANG